MNRIDKKFRELKKLKRKAFIPYITCGDPDLGTTARLIGALENSGADIIELGIPFSDPLADGPVIQAASHRALSKGASLGKAFALVSRIRKKTGIPLVFMTYYNPVLKYGIKKFFKSCRLAGVDGIIIPDMPIEEAKEIIKLGRASRIATIFLAAPTSTAQRIKKIAHYSRGFVYYVSLTGVTGTRSGIAPEIASKIKLIKSYTSYPVAVGFGVSNAAQARQIAASADGVIVGSAIVKIIGEKRNIIKRVSNFARSLARAVHGT